MYGLNSADAVFKETRDRFYIGARKWLNETLRWAGLGGLPGRLSCVLSYSFPSPGRAGVCQLIS